MEHPRKTLQKLGASPIKSLGQNFLVNLHSLEKCLDLLDPSLPLLEIGPGLGAVTEFFREKGFRLTLIEKDPVLANYLQENYTGQGDCEVLGGDFLELGVDELEKRNIGQVVGNLPFYVTSPILTRLVIETPFIDRFLAGVQLDLGQKICGPGNSLALFLQSQGEIRLVSRVTRNSFYPVPGVDGAWIFWKRKPRVEARPFEIFLRGIFWGKRKTLSSSMGRNPFYAQHDISAKWPQNAGRLDQNEQELRPDVLDLEMALQIFQKISRQD